MGFIHLQVKSAYSLLKSSIRIQDYVEYAKELQLETLALVEDKTMHSAIKFYTACKQANIKPIIGVELTVKVDERMDHLILLAKNQSGYESLLYLSSAQSLNDGYVDIEEMIAHASNLIVISDGESSILANAVNEQEVKLYYQRYLERLHHFYIGLLRVDQQTYDTSQRLLEWAKRLGANVVALNDVRYIKKEDAKVLTFLEAIKENQLIEHTEIQSVERYLKSEEEMRALFNDAPHAIDSIFDIVSCCEVEIDLHRSLLPKFPTPSGVDSNDYLEALCYKGLIRRYNNDLTDFHKQRLRYELSVIKKMGFSDYFLIVWDFVKYAKMNHILVGPGRGSAAGSIVAYVLGITNVDPIKYRLLFERFLNPERISMPDIDIDFQDNRRDEVIEYVRQKYGTYSVVQIITFGTFQARSAWRDLARIHGVDTSLINQVAKYIYSGATLRDIYNQNTLLKEFFKNYPKLELIYKEAIKIEGLPRHTSIHAAGVIISDQDLRKYTPIMHGVTDICISQYEAEDLEAIGLLKMDFLGLKNLNMLQQMIALIHETIDSTFDINQIDLQDDKTYQMISYGQTTGVFQLESEGMRQVLRQVRPNQLEDIIACNALFRPGPMENIPLFAARKHQEVPIEYNHPHLEPILFPTYGIIVYQEQIMQIANVICGYSLGEADVLRRAVSKKKKDVLEQEEKKFVEKAIARGYSKDVAIKIYSLILKFANYGFNRSHAVAYSMIAYQMAYLKVHYPAVFMSVALTNVIGSEHHTAGYIRECRQLNLEIFPPSINKSTTMYAIEEGGIRFSLLAIKHIGLNLARQLIEERTLNGHYLSVYDFIVRTKRFMNQRAYEGLIDVGALDEFGYNRATLHHNLNLILDFSKYDGGLFSQEFEMEKISKEIPSFEKMKREKELLGFYLKSHPLYLLEERVKENGWYYPSDVQMRNVTQVSVIGLVEKCREIRDKNGNLMAFLEISDEDTSLNVTIFSSAYKPEYKNLLGHVIVVSGKVTIRNNEKNINSNKIIAIT